MGTIGHHKLLKAFCLVFEAAQAAQASEGASQEASVPDEWLLVGFLNFVERL